MSLVQLISFQVISPDQTERNVILLRLDQPKSFIFSISTVSMWKKMFCSRTMDSD